ncbi:SGNH/GDSL hydrolase family protein [Mariniflexile jejuense]|uniref:SGNH/GDSL hydrolase family protein n=1 Tax=Mariniflexile jejuense TaxID=1173582 RepID=A0ABW3JIP0_9FLAO
MKKKTVFKIIAALLPFLLIFIIEIVLRISGYGENYQLFNKVKVENRPEYLIMNSNISKKYFKNNGFNSDNQSDLFLKTKTSNTFRIFVQGASTVVGFPYYQGGSFPRMLKHRLSQTFPEKNIEIINTGITAVNSYTLWDLTGKIIDQNPDLVIIYAGHNEYYGALGVGSTSSYGSRPTLVRSYLFLKNFRFFQLLDNSYTKLISQKSTSPKVGETTLMEVMVKEPRIPLNSKVYHAGLKQFESNLQLILRKYKKHNIPVIISTLVSNEKDIKPFISDTINNEVQFKKSIEQKSNYAKKISKTNAYAAYNLGLFYIEKNQDSAKKYLHLAKELDYLRFRAPEEINHIILKLAKEYNCGLVDMEAAFLSHSNEIILGNTLLLEHVHPNSNGYFIMADAFYNKIKALQLLKDWNHNISFDEASKDIPITAIDSIKGNFIIDDLKNSWPYILNMSRTTPISSYYAIQNPNYEERRAIEIYKNQVPWRDVMHQSYIKYKNDSAFKKGLHVAQSLIFEYPEEANPYNLAGNMCLKLMDFNKAAYYFFKYNELEKSSTSAQQLASVYIKLNKLDLAKKTLLESKSNGINVMSFDELITLENLNKE